MYKHALVLGLFCIFCLHAALAEPSDDASFAGLPLEDAFEQGCSLVLAEVLSVHKSGGMYDYRARIIRPIVYGDLAEADMEDPLDMFAGASFGDALKPGSTYALFAAKEAPYHFSWAFRNDVVRVDVSKQQRIRQLTEVAEGVYAKTSIRRFRQATVPENIEMPALPPEIVSLCQDFKSNPEHRATAGKAIFESDLGSRIDRSEPESSVLEYLPPKMLLSRSQILSLLGPPTHEGGWTYSWLCGHPKRADAHVYVLSATFNPAEEAVCVLYHLQERSRWTKFTGYLNTYVGLSGQPDAVAFEYCKALREKDWPKALSYCSDPAKAAARQCDSPRAFFESYVPVEKLAALSAFAVRGYGRVADDITRLSFEIRLDVPQAEWPVNWHWSLIREQDEWSVDFKTMPVETLVTKELARRALEKEDGRTRIEKLKQHTEIRLVPLAEEFVIGQPMLFRVEMNSHGDVPILYTAAGPHTIMCNDPMLIVDPSGAVVAYVDTSYQIGVWPDAILPGETIVLADKYDAASQYRIRTPGVHRFQFRGWPRDVTPSNVCELNVRPGQISPADLVFEKLLRVLPEGWTCTRRMSSMRFISEDFSGESIQVGLIGERAGKAIDVGMFLLICLTDRRVTLKPDFVDELAFWGFCRWGPVYAGVQAAEELWPGYKRDIVEVLGIDATIPKVSDEEGP
ncbi:MAG: hypothetical protein JSU70_13920 [Phycisphaerales bacterium]|nr:MAG: hypothetical protein JSU70_13920 [Phycisphaerales bacterium]